MSKPRQKSRPGTSDVSSRMEAFVEICRERDLRVTPQRVEIYREIASTNEHPDAETIYRQVKRRFPSISRDTVYRTLYRFEEEGLLSRVEVLCERVRFDANTEPHHHFICLECGAVLDFYSPVLNKFRPPKAVRAMGSVDSAHLELRGKCAGCSK